MAGYVVTCGSCGAANRIPAEKEGVAGRCGECGKGLPPLYHTPIVLSEGTFDSFVQSYKGPVLAEFWASW